MTYSEKLRDTEFLVVAEFIHCLSSYCDECVTKPSRPILIKVISEKQCHTGKLKIIYKNHEYSTSTCKKT